tara:strand:+ start:67 stop:309 length:243 start_codon:yes stop_codon:yes gene_type:complete
MKRSNEEINKETITIMLTIALVVGVVAIFYAASIDLISTSQILWGLVGLVLVGTMFGTKKEDEAQVQKDILEELKKKNKE